MLRIAINGYGRIGRAVLRALFERNLENQIHIEAINDLSERSAMAHLTRFDTTFGRFHGQVDLRDDVMQIRGQSIRLLQERDPTQLPWKQLGVDVVLECSGKFKKRDLIDQHLQPQVVDRLLDAMAGGETVQRVHATLDGNGAVICEFA